LKKLRLLITEKCNRNCEGCCNKDWDLNKLETISTHGEMVKFINYDEIILTGGEPMLFPDRVQEIAHTVRMLNHNIKVFMYTAKPNKKVIELLLSNFLDGITVTLHEQADVEAFKEFASSLKLYLIMNRTNVKTLRLNIFAGIDISGLNLINWKVKYNIKWLKNCPLPKDEIFMKLAIKGEK